MPIAVLIQLALQGAMGAIDILQRLGYLKPDAHDQVMQHLLDGSVPKEASSMPPKEG